MSKEDELRALREARFVTKPVTPVTKPVTLTRDVTPSVTPCPHCLVLVAEVERLKAELVRVVKLPMTPAERVKKFRKSKKGA